MVIEEDTFENEYVEARVCVYTRLWTLADTVDLLSRTTDRWTTITRDSALARLSVRRKLPELLVERVVRDSTHGVSVD